MKRWETHNKQAYRNIKGVPKYMTIAAILHQLSLCFMNFLQPLSPLRVPFIRIQVNSSFLLYTLDLRRSFFLAQDAVNFWLQFPAAGRPKLEERFSGVYGSLVSIVKAKIEVWKAWCSYWRITLYHLFCPALQLGEWRVGLRPCHLKKLHLLNKMQRNRQRFQR